MNKFKVGDYVIRTERGLTSEAEITIGNSYEVKGYSDMGSVMVVNDLGKEQGYIENYFLLDKNRIVTNILNDL